MQHLKNLAHDAKDFVGTKFGKATLATGAVASAVVSTVTPALAVGTADTGVTTAFQSISDNVVATIEAVGPIVIVIFGAFIMWKYGKKIFNKLG